MADRQYKIRVCTEIDFPNGNDGQTPPPGNGNGNGNGDNGNGNGNGDVNDGTFTDTVGDNENTEFSVEHGLGTRHILFKLLDTDTGEYLRDGYEARAQDDNTLTLNFDEAPGQDAIEVYGHALKADDGETTPPPGNGNGNGNGNGGNGNGDGNATPPPGNGNGNGADNGDGNGATPPTATTARRARR